MSIIASQIFFLYISLDLSFEIEKGVLIGIYLYWEASNIADFNNNLWKRETPIMKVAEKPFFDREEDKQLRKCFELEVFSI